MEETYCRFTIDHSLIRIILDNSCITIHGLYDMYYCSWCTSQLHVENCRLKTWRMNFNVNEDVSGAVQVVTWWVSHVCASSLLPLSTHDARSHFKIWRQQLVVVIVIHRHAMKSTEDMTTVLPINIPNICIQWIISTYSCSAAASWPVLMRSKHLFQRLLHT